MAKRTDTKLAGFSAKLKKGGGGGYHAEDDSPWNAPDRFTSGRMPAGGKAKTDEAWAKPKAKGKKK
jgi:hypothetical protein